MSLSSLKFGSGEAFELRTAPSRPRRLGTLRRAKQGAGDTSATNGSARAKRVSLDNYKYLATSVQNQGETVAQWLKDIDTPALRQKRENYLQAVLINTMHDIWQSGLNPKRDRDWQRLSDCRKEWIGFKAACCNGKAVAVPIGCNHRLCIHCNSHRAEHYRERVRKLFPRLEHPVFLTITVPNLTRISKRSFNRIRWAIRKLIKMNSWAKGGIYSLETTYNRKERTWHVHAHVLIDSEFGLPVSRPAFIRFKRSIEFDWLRLTSQGGGGWKRSNFEGWFAETIQKKSGDPWNKTNRRIVDIRRVLNRDGAAFEVLKYITKVTDFADNGGAVEEFLSAVKGVRMLQTFGSWYGFKFEDDTNDLSTWSVLRCECGENRFERIGLLGRDKVYMASDGRWHVKPGIHFTRSCREGPSSIAEFSEPHPIQAKMLLGQAVINQKGE